MTFSAYIWCFVHTFPFELVPWPSTFDLGGVWWKKRTYQFLASYGYPLLSYVWLNLITLPSLTWNGHCACAVSHDLSKGAKLIYIFWNPWQQFAYVLCHFQGATTKIKPCYMRIIAFIPLCWLESSLRMRSITWPVHRGSPKTTRNNFFTPTYLFTTQRLWRYDDD